MNTCLAGLAACSTRDAAELAHGVDFELFTGPVGETRQDKRARLAAARGVLADLREQGREDEWSARAARFAAALMRGRRPETAGEVS
ncbi:hypothetical protein G5C51_08120 [Streptomyces sp. A7024]|uniref:Uncharacterized protein n=1 Tax=Streptomyces coryli TaxID=1128680 RepID=A0A6G4TVS2_9ACTN|nr:hypothetical protein [Streptomyces coryli]NGN63872.1 hypothetical protein [Streptomyces coryli]